MKKLNKLLALAVLLLTASTTTAQVAETVKGYTFSFDDAKSLGFTESDYSNGSYTSDKHHDFAPKGWGHIADVRNGYYSDTYVAYSFADAKGVANIGALKVGSQKITDEWTYSEIELHDYLVTPLVKAGNVSLKLKQNIASSGDDNYVEFYKVSKNGDAYKVGSKMQVTLPSLSRDSYSTVSFTVDSDTYIGIRADNMYLDDFYADSVTMVKTPGLTILSVENLNGKYNDANSKGFVTLKYNVVLKNTGLVNLKQGDAGYSLSLTKGENGETIATESGLPDLAVNAVDTVVFKATISAANYAEPFKAYLKENVTSTSKLASNVSVVRYKPLFAFTEADDTVKLSGTYDYQIVKTSTTRHFLIRNNGAAPLVITSIDVQAPFQGKIEPRTLEAHDSLALDITLPATKAGQKDGNLVIKGNGLDYSLALTGVVASATQYYESFDSENVYSQTLPSGMMDTKPGNWHPQNYVSSVLNERDNKLNMYAYNSDNNSKLITPLLEVKDGQKLFFYAGKRSARSRINVLYSADRKHWTTVKTIVARDSLSLAPVGSEVFSGDSIVTSSGWSKTANYKLSRFIVDNIPAGKWYVAFESGYGRLDEILGYKKVELDHDVAITSFDAPATGMVNYACNIKLNVHNALSREEDSNTYSATLFANGFKVDSASTVKISGNGDAVLTFSATPHRAGRMPVYAVLDFGDSQVVSDTVSIDVAPEQFFSSVQVGHESTKGITAPLALEDKYSEGVVVYSADDLGLAKGAKITSLTFKGWAEAYSYGSSKDISIDELQIYLGNSSLAKMPEMTSSFNIKEVIDTTKSQKVYDAPYTVTPGGKGSASYYEGVTINQSANLITVNFPEPFVYNGEGIVLYTKAKSANAAAHFALVCDDSKTGRAAGRSGYYSLDNASWTGYGSNNPTSLPVTIFGIDAQAPVVTGKVTDNDGNALDSVVVTFKSNDIIYSDSTKADGTYNVRILQNKGAFTLTAEKKGYLNFIENDVVVSDSLVKNIVLEQNLATGIENVSSVRKHNDTGAIYSIDGRYLGSGIDKAKLHRGIYIINGKKVVVK